MIDNDAMGHVKRKKRESIPNWLLVSMPSILFWFAWEPMPFTPLVFVAFAPLFLLAYRGRKMSGWKHFVLLFSSLLLWNILTTWWVWFASDVGAVAMLLLNSFFMFLPFGLWRMWQRLTPLKGNVVGDLIIFLLVFGCCTNSRTIAGICRGHGCVWAMPLAG
jgi:apolipoprotein N-acyltransferase